MAAKRNKSQAKRNGGGMPGWAWLLVGVALTLVAALVVPKFLGLDGDKGFFRATPTETPPPAVDATGDDEPIVAEDTPAAADTGKPPEYDFYTLLPGEETPISDAELAASARAEEARRQQDAADVAAPANDAGKPPRAIDAADPAESASNSSGSNSNAANTGTTTDTKPPATPDTPANADSRDAGDGARYILQAGAFAASGDAEALKAKIAFLGLSARVESAQIKGKTVYRVRMGPYGSASELAEAKRKLGNGGLPAMAIKAK